MENNINVSEAGRIGYIDTAKAVAIMMIMFGHITDLFNPVDTWMSSMKICVFYVISGFLIAYTNGFSKRTPPQFVKNILKTIAWPYLTFSVIAICAKTIFTLSKHDSLEAVEDTFKERLVETVFLKGINSMWFLPTIFFGELIILLLFLSPKIFRIIFAAVGLLGVNAAVWVTDHIAESGMPGVWITGTTYTVNMLGKSVVAAWFVGFGYILYLIFKRIGWDRDVDRGKKLLVGLLFSGSNLVLSLMNRSVDFNCMSMGDHPILFIYGGTIGSVGLILLLDVASRYINFSPLDYWGRNSLILLCTHTALGFKKMSYYGWKKTAFIPDEAGLEYIIECLAVLVLLLLIMYSVIEGINRWLPFLTKFPQVAKKNTSINEN